MNKDCERYEDKCPECYRPFQTVGALERHINTKHPEEKSDLSRIVKRERENDSK